MTAAQALLELLWRNALVVLPVAAFVILVTRIVPARPATRHALWLIVLLSFILPALVPTISIPAGLSPPELPAPVAAIVPSPQSKPAAAPPTVSLPRLRVAPVVETANPANPTSVVTVDESSTTTDTAIGSMSLIASPDTGSTPQVEPRQASPNVALDEAAAFPWLIRNQLDAPLVGEATASFLTIPSPLHESAPAPIASTDLRPDTSINGSWLNQWIAFLSELRAVVARVPQIPASIWLLGMCVILVTATFHAIRFRRLIAKATPADAELTHMVESAARTIGLRAMPQTFVIDRRISPMVWCGRRLRLVLPLGLWSELDAAGREAVILHELAHIRRRDQWVCWAALLVSIVYWWHPVAWWCHRRLREEADLCCDAWVTALRPKARRAYAQALLTTRSFISDAFHPNPALALGITTPRAKRFARRLTTVMTTHNNPNISRLGCALTAAVALSSWLAAPLWACPPEETAAKAKTTIRVAPAKIAGTARSAPAPTPSADTTFEQHMLERQLAEVAASAHTLSQRAGGENPDVLQRLNALEERLNRLAEQIELFMMKPGAAMPRSGTLESATPSSSAAIAPHAPHTPAPPRKPSITSSPAIAPTPAAPPTPPSAPAAPAPPVVRGAQGGASAGVVFPSQPRSPVIAPGAQAERIERFYPLPAGKREALTTLMSRQDVPILIRPANNGIYVQGTAQEHEAFQAFVQLIHPEAAPAQASGFDPKAAAILEAQYRAAAQAQASTQRAAAQRLLTTERARAQQLMQKERQNAETLRRQARETAMGMRELERAARMAERQAETVEQQMEKVEGAELDALRARLEALLKEVSALENEIFKLETTAQELDAKAESLLENAEAQAQMILEAAEQQAEALRDQAQASASLR